LYMAQFVKKVVVMAISDKTITKDRSKGVNNFELVVYDGINVDMLQQRIDVVYSHQLIEHLHPEDAFMQLKSVLRVLGPGGKYICITPHRFSGPHDISKYFDRESTCFHLKEYTNEELYLLFKEAGFSKIEFVVRAKDKTMHFPCFIIISIEKLLGKLPYKIRKAVSSWKIIQLLLGITIVGTK